MIRSKPTDRPLERPLSADEFNDALEAAPRKGGKPKQRNPYLSSLGKARSELSSDYDRKLFGNMKGLPWIPMTKTWQMRMHDKEEKQIDRRVRVALACCGR